MKSQKGFTLVETIIALSVTGMLIFIIINFMTNSIVQYSHAGARSELLGEAQSALDLIGNDIRLAGNADAINRWPDTHSPDAPDNTLSWQSDNDTLILATAVEDTNGDIIFADPALYISEKNNVIYFISNNTLYKRTLASNVEGNTMRTSCPNAAETPDCPRDRTLLENVETFEVKYYNDQNQEVIPTEARSIEIYVKLQSIKYDRPVSVDYSTRMVFRND